MAARGSIAKEKVTNMIAKAFGSNFLGEHDKKLYVQQEENGEMVQIAIAMTCPKNPIGVAATPKAVNSGVLDFEEDNTSSIQSAAVEVSEEEKANIAELMKRLGL